MFKKKNYTVIKKATSEDTAKFLYNYLFLKKKVAAKLFESGFITEFDNHYGVFGDGQCPNAYSHYGDIAMETLLLDLLPKMEKHTECKLIPTYSYTRFYTKGDELKKHKDRHECEISTTLNLGGDEWPIFIQDNPKEGQMTDNGYVPSKSKGSKVILKPGDMLVYRGHLLEHWREKFKGNTCAQVFLHYNSKNYKYKNPYDQRPFIGLPTWFKGRK